MLDLQGQTVHKSYFNNSNNSPIGLMNGLNKVHKHLV